MTERLLQYIWQFQHFNKSEIETTAGDQLQIIFPGHYNTNQGPDFLDARIRSGKTIWAGSVELHLKTSGWKLHKHDRDKNYGNVVLHVVWENDLPPDEATGGLPVLELKSRVSKILLQRYDLLMHTGSFIPCEKLVSTVRAVTLQSWKDRLVAERLMRKSAVVKGFLKENNYHWEEAFWWMLARSFGAKVNAGAFEEVARSLPVTVLAKHKLQIHQLEALLLGQAGLLAEYFEDDYATMLQREYRFLQHKYGLKPVHQPVHFLRMRPGNFPTIRLAQLAALIQNSAHLFSRIKEAASVKEIKTWFAVAANDYWHYHYRFGKPSAFKKKEPGGMMTDTIIINTICPVLFAYGDYHQELQYKDKAIQWLEQTTAEKNTITSGFAELGFVNKNAFDSQSLIELKNEYCNKKRCLECGLGNAVLK